MANRGSSWNTKMAELRRNAQVVELFCQGKTQVDIGKLFGLSQGRIGQIVAQAKQEWLARKEVATEDHINVSLMKLDEVYGEARLGWERSYQDAVTIVTKKALRAPKLPKKTVEKARAKMALIAQDETRKGQAGDPTFLHIMLDVTNTRLKLLGAFPKEDKTEVNNVVQINWGDLSKPIISVEPLPETPSSEVERRIAAESQPSPNGNGQH